MKQSGIIKCKEKHQIIISSIMLILVIFWSFLIFSFSSMNADESSNTSNKLVANFIESTLNFTNKIGATNAYFDHNEIIQVAKVINPLVRKLAHFTEYLILAVLIILYINYTFKVPKYIYLFLISIIICIIYASVDEFHQLFVSGRTGKFVDVCIDTSGALMGLILCSTYYLAYWKGKKH